MTIKKAVLALISGLLLAVLLPLTASPAQASPAPHSFAAAPIDPAAPAKCKGKSCTGKNPHTTNCDDDARTIDRVQPGGGGPVIQLRYSDRCRAAWAHARDKINSSWNFKIEGRGGPIHTAHGSLQYKAYTRMIGRPKEFRACVKQYSSDAWTCTSWH